MSRLRVAYRAWLQVGDDLDCGLQMARVMRGHEFTRLEDRCVKHATALRALGETVPAVPGEASFR